MSTKYHFMLAWLVCCWTGIAGHIVSRNRTVYMSSQHSIWSGERVVDGNYRTDADACGCCAATITETDPWITIDLGDKYMITWIRVFGRTDHSGQDLNGLVFILDHTRFTPTTDSTPIRSYEFTPDQPTVAQNVTLMLPGENRILALCEFEVFNDIVISTNKSITASSTFWGWETRKAVDGNISTDGNGCKCCAATNLGTDNPWMRVDLRGYFYITYIIIYGRTDDNPSEQRFDGLQIELGNETIIKVPNTTNYYDSGAIREGPATYIELQLIGLKKTLVVCELQVFGECYDYYYGNCSTRCGHCHGNQTCDIIDGTCRKCADGYTETDRLCNTACLNGSYGHNCTGVCGHCKDGAICNKTNGVCDQCEDGYMATDMLCVEPCEDGYYGNNCTSMCGHCKNEAICNKTNGVCDQCEDGYMETDMLCVEPCNNDTYGHNCSKECGHCSEGEVCRHSDGFCSACGYMYTDEDTTCKTEASQDEEGSSYVEAISGTVVGVIVLACLAIGAIIFKRRRYGKEKSQQTYGHEPIDLKDEVRGQQKSGFEAVCPEDIEESGTYYNLVPMTKDIPVPKLWSFVYETRKNRSDTLIKQYEDIGEHISPTKEAMAYRYKIRYKDMLPYDHTRVHLDVEEEGECEFINASHIHGFDRQNKFIASQGPMDVMVDDFWRMVWQQDSKKIVMLTNVKENGSVKCIQYWPELGEVITQRRIQITLVKEETTTDYVIRTLELKQGQSKPKVIQQFHYKAWPDKDVPDSAWSLVLFWREVFKENDSSAGPIIVHCSAGVGRTGTFIALDNLYHQALQTWTINPFEIVSSLRTQRLKMVQTQTQYIYLHDAVAESLSIGTHYIWQTQFESYYNYMVKLDKGASQSRLQNQYQLMLDGMEHMKTAMKGGASEEHIYSNTEINEYKPQAQTCSTYEDVLGGKTLSNYAGKKSFMIMTLPNKQDIHSIWNLLESRNIKTVVTLTYDGDPSAKLWSSPSSTKQGNSSTNSLVLMKEDKEEGLCIRTYEFTKDNKPPNKCRGVVKEFELTTAKSAFPNRDTMVKVLQEVFLWHQYLSESEQILIQCRDGEGQSGMMCVLLNEVARMKGDGHIHVLESVTLMKQQVAGIIPNVEQYKYIHDVILDMVKTKD